MDRKKRLYLNTFSALFRQFVGIICGFILPREILMAYGSNINGTVSSITQFLSFISLFDMGVSSVVQSLLYKPLAEKDLNKLSIIVDASKKFYRKICFFLILYTCILMLVYPYIINSRDIFGTSALIFAISLSLLGEYLFGITNQTVLDANQQSYIQNACSIITLVLNTILSVALIKCGATITYVKLVSSLIFLLKPLFMNFYVNKKFNIKKNISYEGNQLPQKWNGLAHHLASFIFGNTDIAILTFMSTMDLVSVYSVYLLVVSNLNRLIATGLSGIKAYLGDLYARNEIELLKKKFLEFEMIVHIIGSFIFSCCLTLIIPFIKVYTRDIYDINYIYPFFSLVLVLGYEINGISNIYNIVIASTGKFKETQLGSIVEALINISLSLLLVKKFNILGVAIGTLVALVFKQIYYIYYLHRNVIEINIKHYLQLVVMDLLIIFFSIILTSNIGIKKNTYIYFLILALKKTFIVFLICLPFLVYFIKKRFKLDK